jgi:hypothetical protein
MSVGLEGKQSLANLNHDACTVDLYQYAKVGIKTCQITWMDCCCFCGAVTRRGLSS